MGFSKNEKVLLWGDSLGKGVIWNDQRGRYAFARENATMVVEEKLGITVINRSKFGITAPQGLAIMERDLSEGITGDVGVIEFGGNDCNFAWEQIASDPETRHDPHTSPELYEKTLRSMIRQLTDRCIRPVLVTLPPINAERYFHFLVGDKLNGENILKWLGDVQQIYRYQEMYSAILEEVARDLRVELLDLRVRCLAKFGFATQLLCSDGLHLTDEGQRFVGEQIVHLVLASKG